MLPPVQQIPSMHAKGRKRFTPPGQLAGGFRVFDGGAVFDEFSNRSSCVAVRARATRTRYRMRLLNTKSLKVEEFPDDRDLRYAILSHRWCDEEVTLKDIRKECASWKAGYSKICKCCFQARQDGWDYIWVDTCCIDKTSSAELSEAINSMYRWYQNAGTCYVYLFDVHIAEETVPVEAYSVRKKPPIEFKEILRKSSWWTRGWTLQELIAPSVVQFYDSEWKLIGSKRGLSEHIASITGIKGSLLRGRDRLEAFSVAQRMSWASRRETTRIEDMAYSLMGLFDVNMPMLYGEGEKAFVRLQEEIMKHSDDQTIFAWTMSEQSDYSGLLAQRPSQFANCANVTRLPAVWKEQTYATTNRGLSITLPMNKWHMEAYRANLSCCDKSGRAIGIFLSMLHEKDQYMRMKVNGESLDTFRPPGDSLKSQIKSQRHVYVRQATAASLPPTARLYGFWLRTLPPLAPRWSHEPDKWPDSFSYHSCDRIFEFVPGKITSVWAENKARVCPSLALEFDDEFNPVLRFRNTQKIYAPSDRLVQDYYHNSRDFHPEVEMTIPRNEGWSSFSTNGHLKWSLKKAINRGKEMWVFDVYVVQNEQDYQGSQVATEQKDDLKANEEPKKRFRLNVDRIKRIGNGAQRFIR